MVCDSYTCRKLRAEHKGGTQYYGNGLKFCSSCDTWFNFKGSRCPCCNRKLRTKAKNKTISYSIEGDISKTNDITNGMELIQTTVYITKDHKSFINENYINLSRFVRNGLDEFRKKKS